MHKIVNACIQKQRTHNVINEFKKHETFEHSQKKELKHKEPKKRIMMANTLLKQIKLKMAKKLIE